MGPLAFLGMLVLSMAAFAGFQGEQMRERVYVQRLLETKTALDRAYTESTRDSAGNMESATVEDVARLHEASQEALREMEELDPPEHLEDEDRKILAALRTIERGTADLLAGYEGGGRSALAWKGSEQYFNGNLELEKILEGKRRGAKLRRASPE